MEVYMLLIKTLKIHIDNHSEIPYQTLKQNSYHKLYKKKKIKKINALQRIRKLITKKKKKNVNSISWFQIIGGTSSSYMCKSFSSLANLVGLFVASRAKKK